MELNKLSLLEAIESLKEKKISAKELVNDCLKRIKVVDEKVKAFITVCEKEADEQLRLIGNSLPDTEKPLLGIPFAIKDNFNTKGIKTTASASVLADYCPVYDATVVEKLKNAGAIVLGKTNMDAWAHGSSTETSDFFTTRNPWDLNKLPGGSSGGSSVAVSADEIIAAIGSETAGSIRQPASWCGVVGLKPTYGRVSRYGLIAMASSTDCPGPLCKTVSDAALILKIISGKDEYDATTLNFPVPDYQKALTDKSKIKDLKIGIPKQYFIEGIEEEVRNNTLKAIEVFKKLGAEIKEISLLDPKYSVAVYTILQRSEVPSNLARYDGIRFGKDRSHFNQEAKRRIMLGTYTLSKGYYDQYYLKAQKVRTLICQDFTNAFKEVDLIVSPTTPCTALPLGSTKDSAMFGEFQDILVEGSSIAGLPGINLVSGFSTNGMPTGLQIIGPSLNEELILNIAFLYEQETKWFKNKPKL